MPSRSKDKGLRPLGMPQAPASGALDRDRWTLIFKPWTGERSHSQARSPPRTLLWRRAVRRSFAPPLRTAPLPSTTCSPAGLAMTAPSQAVRGLCGDLQLTVTSQAPGAASGADLMDTIRLQAGRAGRRGEARWCLVSSPLDEVSKHPRPGAQGDDRTAILPE